MKPQVTISEKGPLWPWLLIAALFITIIIVLIYLFKKRSGEEILEPVIVDPPHIIALNELEAIEKMNLIREEKIKELYSHVSDVLRVYVGVVYHVDAMEMTTGELLDALDGKPVKEKSAIARFMNDCDLVKFAKVTPPQMDIESLLDRGRKIIHLHRPEVDENGKGAVRVSTVNDLKSGGEG